MSDHNGFEDANSHGGKPRFRNVVTTGNVMSAVVAFTTAFPVLVAIWQLAQWPATIEHKLSDILTATNSNAAVLSRQEAVLSQHGGDISQLRVEINELRRQLMTITIARPEYPVQAGQGQNNGRH